LRPKRRRGEEATCALVPIESEATRIDEQPPRAKPLLQCIGAVVELHRDVVPCTRTRTRTRKFEGVTHRPVDGNERTQFSHGRHRWEVSRRPIGTGVRKVTTNTGGGYIAVLGERTALKLLGVV